MKIYPAIDLKGGTCVRLKKGDMSDAKVFSTDPLNQAKIFEESGFQNLHIVDLDGAVNGYSANADPIISILENTSLSVQVGGGIRTIDNVDYWFSKGVKRIIVGTKAIKDLHFLNEITSLYPGKIIVSLDLKDKFLAINGWSDLTSITVFDFLEKIKDFQLHSVVITDIDRDGMLFGPNIDLLKEIAAHNLFSITASGGISSIQDIENLKQIDGVSGTIVGTAIYEKMIDLGELVKASS